MAPPCAPLTAEHRDNALVLNGNNVSGLRSLFAFLNIELDCLALMHTVILPITSAVMKKNISRSFDGNETESFLGFLLNGSCRHERIGGKKKYCSSVHLVIHQSQLESNSRNFLTFIEKIDLFGKNLRRGYNQQCAYCEPLPTLPIQKKYAVCLVKECGKDSYGRQYCEKHTSVDLRRRLPNTLRAHIRSHCCSAKCVSGKAHENGEQYCAKCKEPCCWKTQ